MQVAQKARFYTCLLFKSNQSMFAVLLVMHVANLSKCRINVMNVENSARVL